MQERGRGLEGYYYFSPAMVVQQTGELLSTYFRGNFGNRSLALDYLETSTTRFVGEAIQGFLLSDSSLRERPEEKEFRRMAGKNKVKPKRDEFLLQLLQFRKKELSKGELTAIGMQQDTLESLSQKGRIEVVRRELGLSQTAAEPVSRNLIESYALTRIIFAQMKPKAPSTVANIVANLDSPRDDMEMLDRLEELGDFVKSTVRQEVTPENLGNDHNATRRGLTFFEVGKELPLKELRLSVEEEVMQILENTPLN